MRYFCQEKSNGLLLALAILMAGIGYVLLANAVLDAPTDVTFTDTASANFNNKNFSVNWTAPAITENISNYTVYIINASTGALMNVTSNTTVTGYYFNFSDGNGNYTFNISAVNATGNESANASSSWMYIDLVPPVITIHTPANDAKLNYTPYLNGTVAEAASLAWIKTNSTYYSILDSTSPFNFTNLSAIPEGTHTINISANDSAGNVGNASITFTYDVSAPSITLNTPLNNAYVANGKLNFTFTQADAASSSANCSLWLMNSSAASTWHLNMTNIAVSNNTATKFAFDSGTNILLNGTYRWNVQCYDIVNNSAWASANYTFTVGDIPDLIVTNVRLVDSAAPQWNNPVPGSYLTVNATVMNNGSVDIASDINVALFWEGSGTPLIERTVSSASLTARSAINITFNISGLNVSGYGSHSVRVLADYGAVITEANETNNDRTINIFSGLNISNNMTVGSSLQSPVPGGSVLLNITVRYQNGTPVTNLTAKNFTVYDVYTYDNLTTIDWRSVTDASIPSFIGNQNTSGIYTINITAPAKTSANWAESGNHSIRVYVIDNKSMAYYGWDNSSYYTLMASDPVLSFGSTSYSLDFASGTWSYFTIQIKNNGTLNITNMSIVISSNNSALTLSNDGGTNYSQTIYCRYNSTPLSPGTTVTSTGGCSSLKFQTTTRGGYTLTLNAGGWNNGNSADLYNATSATVIITVTNSTTPANSSSTTTSSSSSSSSSSTTTTTTTPARTYTLSITDYNKSVPLEQGQSARLSFKVKNTGTGNITGIAFSMSLPADTNWISWYTAPVTIGKLLPGASATVSTNLSVPSNATVSLYTVTAKFAGAESGSTASSTFSLQVLPGATEREAINTSLVGFAAQIASINVTLMALIEKTGNENLTVAKNKLSRAKELLEDAQTAISTGDYFSAYNDKVELTTLLSEVREIMDTEKETSAKETTKTNRILLAVGAIIALAALGYYLWMPDEGYNPTKGGFTFKGKNNTFKGKDAPMLERLKDTFKNTGESLKVKPKEALNNISEKVSEKTKRSSLLNAAKPVKSFSYAPSDPGIKGKLKKMHSNLKDQITEYKKEDKKKVYNFQKKKKWDAPS